MEPKLNWIAVGTWSCSFYLAVASRVIVLGSRHLKNKWGCAAPHLAAPDFGHQRDAGAGFGRRSSPGNLSDYPMTFTTLRIRGYESTCLTKQLTPEILLTGMGVERLRPKGVECIHPDQGGEDLYA
jgi:hypothetical protein